MELNFTSIKIFNQQIQQNTLCLYYLAAWLKFLSLAQVSVDHLSRPIHAYFCISFRVTEKVICNRIIARKNNNNNNNNNNNSNKNNNKDDFGCK